MLRDYSTLQPAVPSELLTPVVVQVGAIVPAILPMLVHTRCFNFMSRCFTTVNAPRVTPGCPTSEACVPVPVGVHSHTGGPGVGLPGLTPHAVLLKQDG